VTTSSGDRPIVPFVLVGLAIALMIGVIATFAVGAGLVMLLRLSGGLPGGPLSGATGNRVE